MAHIRTADNSESYCTETGEFDVYVDGRSVAVGPQPDDYCFACREGEPEWEVVTEEEFSRRYPRT